MLVDEVARNSEDMFELEATMIRQLRSQITCGKSSIEELKMLKEQNDMIRELRNGLRIGQPSKTTITEPDEGQGLSQLDTYSVYDENRCPSGREKSWKGLKSHRSALKPLKHMSQNNSFNQVEDRLNQVLDRCDTSTYLCMKQLFQQNKQLLKSQDDSKYYQALYLKQKALHDECRDKLSEYECRMAELQAALRLYSQYQNPNEDKIKYLQLMSQLTDREQGLTKLQTALLIKEKLVRSDTKMLRSQQANLAKQVRQVEQQRAIVESVWEEVLERTDLDHSFRQGVLSKSKQQLARQRKLLSEQQSEQERRHQTAERIIEQLRLAYL